MGGDLNREGIPDLDAGSVGAWRKGQGNIAYGIEASDDQHVHSFYQQALHRANEQCHCEFAASLQ